MDFSPATRDWFDSTFAAPTPAQVEGWQAISRGEHTLIARADRLGQDARGVPVVPGSAGHRAAANRSEAALSGAVRVAAQGAGARRRAQPEGAAGRHPPGRAAARRAAAGRSTVALRTGDTSSQDRRDIARTPPDILITTPESLYLLLTSQREQILHSVRWVIVDEIHSVAATKRGAHLALSLERLAHVAEQPVQRIGLSATQRPMDEVGRFLGGVDRAVTLVDVGQRKTMALEVIVPLEDMDHPEQVEAPSSGSVLGPEARRGRRSGRRSTRACWS